jgi:hypothetical protein
MGIITPMMALEELGVCSANVHEEATLSHPELLKGSAALLQAQYREDFNI